MVTVTFFQGQGAGLATRKQKNLGVKFDLLETFKCKF